MQGAILMFSGSPPRVPSTMGSRSYLLIFLVILLASSLTVSLSQPLHSDPIFSQPPTSSPASDAAAAALSTSATLRRHHFRGILLGLVFGSLSGFLASLLFIFSLRHCLFYATRSPVLAGPMVFTPDINPSDLCAALSAGDPHPTQLIGSGPSGKYYRVVLQGGLVQLAVKTIEPNCPECSPAAPSHHRRRKLTRRHRRVQQGLELLGAVRHRNVMPLRAYHHLDEQHGSRHYLAYDYMPHGSLDDAMRQHRGDGGRSRELVAVAVAAARLGWAARHRIAVGVAKGLRHLHFECSPRILHCRLKPANVVLDEEMEPRLTDCGLGRLHLLVAGDDDADGGTGFVGSYSSYTAPECFQNLR